MAAPTELKPRTPPPLDSIFHRHGVAQWWLFGSRASDSPSPGSDWDFLVEFKQPPSFDQFMDLKLQLEEKLGASVDILSRSACTPRFLKAIGAIPAHAP